MSLIKQYKDKALFKMAELLKTDEFGESLDKDLSKMAEIMYASQGVGLAAPQIGDLRRMFVADIGFVVDKPYGTELIKMVNPRIISESLETVTAEEGCLSYPGLAVNIIRPVAIRVGFFTPYGKEMDQTFIDWQARIIAHEIDHLNGETLYTKASHFVKKRYDEKLRKIKK